MSIYNVDQTGPKIQLGGLKLGRIISEYQGSLKEEVAKLPIPDAKKVTKSINTKDKYFSLNIKKVYSLSYNKI